MQESLMEEKNLKADIASMMDEEKRIVEVDIATEEKEVIKAEEVDEKEIKVEKTGEEEIGSRTYKISVALQECVIEDLEEIWKVKSRHLYWSVGKICDEIDILM